MEVLDVDPSIHDAHALDGVLGLGDQELPLVTPRVLQIHGVDTPAGGALGGLTEEGIAHDLTRIRVVETLHELHHAAAAKVLHVHLRVAAGAFAEEDHEVVVVLGKVDAVGDLFLGGDAEDHRIGFRVGSEPVEEHPLVVVDLALWNGSRFGKTRVVETGLVFEPGDG